MKILKEFLHYFCEFALNLGIALVLAGAAYFGIKIAAFILVRL